MYHSHTRTHTHTHSITGKTSTLALLLNQDPPTIRRSTPCARRPVRILPLISDSQEKSWLVLADFGLKTVLADFVKAEEKFIQLRRQRPSATFTVSSKSSNTRTSLTDESQPSSQVKSDRVSRKFGDLMYAEETAKLLSGNNFDTFTTYIITHTSTPK